MQVEKTTFPFDAYACKVHIQRTGTSKPDIICMLHAKLNEIVYANLFNCDYARLDCVSAKELWVRGSHANPINTVYIRGFV